MHLALTRQVESVSWRIPEAQQDRAPGEARLLEGVTIEPAGFTIEERLWPKAEAAFSGYQLLLEYFTFREKFLFVDLCGLDAANLPANVFSFELEILLKHGYPSDQSRSRR
jgi:Uncharacterized protein conserved in bacteria